MEPPLKSQFPLGLVYGQAVDAHKRAEAGPQATNKIVTTCSIDPEHRQGEAQR